MLAILDPDLRHSSPSRAQSAALIGSLAVIALVVGAAAPARRVLAQDSTASAQSAGNVNHDTARGAELPYEQHSAPGGYAYRKTERQLTNTVTSRVNEQLNERVNEHVNEGLIDRKADAAAERALTRRGVDIGHIADAQLRGTIGALLSGDHRSGSKDSDDRPILLAKVLRTDTSAALRRVAAWGLSEYADNETAVAALSDAVLHDKDVDVREMAAWALGDGDEDDRRSAGTSALAGALKSDASVKVRATAAWALGNIGSRSSVDALVAALNDASPEVRRRAAWGIGNIGPHEAPDAVIALLKDKDPQVRELAAWDLYQMEDPKAAPALQAALKTEQDKDLQLAYIRAIAVTGEKSVDAIRDLLESSDQRVRTMAVKALAGGDAAGPWPWPWPEPRPYP